MAHGPRYRKPFKRRGKGKTNYHKRLKLLKSRKLRLVIRASNNHVTVQIVRSKIGGDEVLVSAFSRELTTKFGWNANTGNLPAAYLTGYIAGVRAKKQDIDDALLDLGVFYHRNRVLAAFKGFLDSAEKIEVPYREDFFPEGLEERANGAHIENYAKELKQQDAELYQMRFSGYIKKKVNPATMSKIISTTKKQIESNA